jgi:hypothetical protein
MAVKHIKTKTGFELDIDDSCIDDMELLDAVANLQSGDTFAIPVVISKICGESKKALYDHCRLESGRVPTRAVAEEINAIFEAINAKNS